MQQWSNFAVCWIDEGMRASKASFIKKKIFNILSAHTFFCRTKKMKFFGSASAQIHSLFFDCQHNQAPFQSFQNFTQKSTSVPCHSKNHLVLHSDSKSMLIDLHHTFGDKDQASSDTS